MVALSGFWRRLRIRNKIVLPLMTIALLMAVTITPITAAVFSTRTNERAAEQITGVANLFKVIVSQRESDLLALARALPTSTELQSAWDSGDARTLAALLVNYRAHFSLDTILMLDQHGRRQIGFGDPFHPSFDMTTLSVVSRSMSGAEAIDILDTGNGLCVCVAEPIPSGDENVSGIVLIGNLLDDQYVGKLKQSSGVDILLRRDGQIIASTLPGTVTRALAVTTAFREAFRWVSVGKGPVQDSVTVLGLPYRVSHSALETPQGNVIEYSMLLPMAQVESATRETIILFLIMGGTGTLVLMLVGLLIARYVSGRLGELVVAARRLARGDLMQRIHVQSEDEVGELARAFNQMAHSLEVREQTVRNQQGELESHNAALMRLNRLSQSINASLELQGALGAVAEATTELLHAPLSGIALVDSITGELYVAQERGRSDFLSSSRLKPGGLVSSMNGAPELMLAGVQGGTNGKVWLGSSSGDRRESFNPGIAFPQSLLDERLAAQVLRGGEILASYDVNRDATMAADSNRPEKPAVLCARLQLQERSLGVIYVCDVAERRYTVHEQYVMSLLASQATVAIANARLYEDARDKAAALSTMVQEMHHRIKNNLQTVADLLSLEMMQLGPDFRGGLGDSIARVKSIATVHELLSVDDTAYTDVREIAERLLKMAIQTSVPPGKRISGSVTGSSFRLLSKQATSLALVLNELISNALEHAFVGRDSGAISIYLEIDAPQGVIRLSDDGIGLPQEFSVDAVDTLGLQIVKTLVAKELRGSLSFESREGTTAVIRFTRWE